jgi:hypothetical protein
VRAIEVEHNRSVDHRIGFEKSTARAGVRFAGAVIENKKQTFRRLAARSSQLPSLAVDPENCGTHHRRWW